MIKGSGINYFINQVGINDLLRVFYTFESGNDHVPSVSGGNPIYSGLINGDTGVFWQKPGSGLFSGTFLTINETGLGGEYFTNLFSFEAVKTGKQLLVSTLENGSGYEVGLNDAHRLYFRTKNNGVDNYSVSNINISSKNLVSFGYLTNYLEIGYYNFNSKLFETESFNQDFGQVRNDSKFVIGSGFEGYMDYFLNFNLLINSDSLNEIASGWCFIPTGFSYETEEVCSNGVTGFGPVLSFQTGFISYSGEILESDGIGDFTGAFPIRATGYRATGIIGSGYELGILTEQQCVTYTGSSSVLYDIFTGYASSYGMDKALITNYLSSQDLIKIEKEYVPFKDFYNKRLTLIDSGFYFETPLNSGTNLYLNGVGAISSGFNFTGEFVISNQFLFGDEAIFDQKSGDKKYYTTGFNSLAFNYSGQQLFLNGQNLISGDGFIYNGAITLTGQMTGISGVVFEFPVVLSYETGQNYLWTGQKFSRNGSIVFLNGIRQEINEDYSEGSKYDLLITNSFNDYNNNQIYQSEGTFWE